MKKVLVTLGSVVVLTFTACGGSATQTENSDVVTQNSDTLDVGIVSNKTTLEKSELVALNSYPPIPQIPADK